MNSYICLNVFLITALVLFSVIEKFSFAENTTESPKRKASASITVPVSIGSACSLCVLIGICCCVCICRRKCRRRNKTKQTVNVNVNTNTVTNAATTAMQPTMPMMAPYAYPPLLQHTAAPSMQERQQQILVSLQPTGKRQSWHLRLKQMDHRKTLIPFFKNEINANVFRHIGQHAAERANDSLQLFRFTVIYFFLLIYSISKILVHFVQRTKRNCHLFSIFLKMKNFVLCVLFSAILVSGQIFRKKDSNAVDSEDALKQKIQDIESWIKHRKDEAKNPGKFDEILFAASLKCPSECLKFIDKSPKMHELCLLKCQKKLLKQNSSLYK
ncbi:Tetraspanin-3 [Trichinella spiralis]|uniref:Tetraspanin-3 n=1 Tax=Trichinella spiralis TaxID=6334 RepID=A0ABR3KDL6_TRISP